MTGQMRNDAARAVDPAELARFVISGGLATLGNLAVVWVLRTAIPYEVAVAAGIATGFVLSLALTRLFAFRGGARQGAGTTLRRFLIVYLTGVNVNLVLASLCGRWLLPHWFAAAPAQMGGALIGAGSMVVTGYFGHRFFTYRTGRQSPTD